VSGAWILPLFGIGFWMLPASTAVRTALAILVILAAPLPAALVNSRQRRRLIVCAAKAEEEAAQLKLQLDTVRFRTNRLRKSAGSRPAGTTEPPTNASGSVHGRVHARFQQSAGNCGGRLEVLLDERKEDASLCADLEQMLKETRYMGNIAGLSCKLWTVSGSARSIERRSKIIGRCDDCIAGRGPAMFPM